MLFTDSKKAMYYTKTIKSAVCGQHFLCKNAVYKQHFICKIFVWMKLKSYLCLDFILPFLRSAE